MLTHVKKLWTGQEGQGMAEYGLILALVAIAVIVALGNLGKNISAKVEEVSTTIEQAVPENN
ncbi:MAG: Flp family type IVb pilin [Tepidanaerobacteraceae bacterium]|jgi:pilus assembly protein Flp/PilA|nr:Flp family type IVb pilin [Tepidanaerobacter sp.]HQE06059.1 Flp family type IVb pilin [Tepidanaerobacteraceae bacterium]